MEKKKPHYELLALQADVSRMGQAAFTGSALAGGYRIGLSLTQMLNVIASLKRSDFYKSMTTYSDSRRWQDVYRPSIAGGVELYVKVTYQADNGPRSYPSRRDDGENSRLRMLWICSGNGSI